MPPAGSFEAVVYGVDDLTVGFDMEGTAMVPVLNEAPGVQQRRGKMLGEPASWGKRSHLFGRSEAKLAAPGELCAPHRIGIEVQALLERMRQSAS